MIAEGDSGNGSCDEEQAAECDEGKWESKTVSSKLNNAKRFKS
jgi:hypothetical protein